MSYKNYMEDAVEGLFNEIVESLDGVCTCARCREDMISWSLNRLPAKYVTTEMGAVYTRFNQLQVQSRADILVTMMKAAKVVKENPRH